MQDNHQNDLRFNTGRYPCAICNKLIRSNGRKLECSLCNLCYHFNCISLTLSDYKYFKSSSLGWTCQTCSKSIFPFHSIEDNELVKLSFNSNLSCLCSKNTVNAILEDLPMLQTISNIGNIGKQSVGIYYMISQAICLIFSSLRGLLFQDKKRKNINEIILIIMKKLL